MSEPMRQTVTVRPTSWRCSCRHRLGGLRLTESIRTAEAHAQFHSGRHEYVTVDMGAIAGVKR